MTDEYKSPEVSSHNKAVNMLIFWMLPDFSFR